MWVVFFRVVITRQSRGGPAAGSPASLLDSPLLFLPYFRGVCVSDHTHTGITPALLRRTCERPRQRNQAATAAADATSRCDSRCQSTDRTHVSWVWYGVLESISMYLRTLERRLWCAVSQQKKRKPTAASYTVCCCSTTRACIRCCCV